MDLIILGNGFDLHCGLQSRYQDFIEVLINDKYYRRNIFAFLFCKESNYQKWFDVEQSIETFLRSFLEKRELVKERNLNATTWNTNIRDRHPAFFDLENLFPDILKYPDLNKWISNYKVWSTTDETPIDSNISSLMNIGEYTELKEILCNQDVSLEKKRYSLINFFRNQLREIEDIFAKFLDNQCHNLGYKDKANRTISQMVNTSTSDSIIMNFNYTNPFNNNVTNNIHGNIKDKNCIFGIDILHLPEDSILIPFTKSFRKLHLNQNDTMLANKEDIKNIFFYGHGLGENDYSYFQAIFDSINLYSSDINLYFYYSVYDKNNEQFIKHDEYMKVIKLISKYGKTLNNKDQGKTILPKLLVENRIHIIEL